MLVPTYAMVLFCKTIATSQPGVIPHRWYLVVVLGTFLLTFFIPFSALLLLWKGDIRQVYMSSKESRYIPYFYGLISAILWYFFLYKVISMPPIVNWLTIGAIICLILVTLINSRWKISAHLTMMGVLLGSILAYCYYIGLFPYGLWLAILLISWIVMWARLFLNTHTQAEVTVGYLMGIVVTFSIGLCGTLLFS